MPRLTLNRHARLLALLDERGERSVAQMVRALAVSEATLRRDLSSLEAARRLVRTFGGARPAPPPSLLARTFGDKLKAMRKEKEAIARAAAKLVEPGMVVALDSGTTVWRLAAMLKAKAPLTVLASALAPVEELGGVAGITIHLVGGRFRPENLDFVGPATVERFAGLHADIAFFGADSFLPGRGAFSLDETSAAAAASVAACADKKVLVLDHTKFGARACCLTVPLEKIDCLITDAGLDAKNRRRLQSAPFELVLAPS